MKAWIGTIARMMTVSLTVFLLGIGVYAETTDPEVLDRIRIMQELEEEKNAFRGIRERTSELDREIAQAKDSMATPIDVMIGGRFLKTDVDAIAIAGRTCVPLRAVVETFGLGEISWDAERYKAVVEREGQTIQFLINKSVIVVNGEAISVDAPTVVVDGRTLVAIRHISEILGFDVEWDPDYYVVSLSHEGYQVNQEGLEERFYSLAELKNFSKLVMKEAGYQVYETKHGVASVVMNRYDSKLYPDTIDGVIFDRGGAVQFPPAHKSSFEQTVPNRETVLAVKKAIGGENSVGPCLYFNTSPFKGLKIYKVADGEYFCY